MGGSKLECGGRVIGRVMGRGGGWVQLIGRWRHGQIRGNDCLSGLKDLIVIIIIIFIIIIISIIILLLYYHYHHSHYHYCNYKKYHYCKTYIFTITLFM